MTCATHQAEVAPRVTHIWQYVDAFARTEPENVAIECGSVSITYRELSTQSRTLAARLLDIGVMPGQIVAVAMPRDHRALILFLAILRAGAVYLPLSPDLHIHRNRLILADAEPALLVVDELPESGLSLAWGAICRFDDLEAAAIRIPSGPVAPGNLAYIIYTSGSTGVPKGVMVTQTNLACLLGEIEHEFALGRSERCLLYHSLTFDFSIWEIAICFIFGCSLIVPEEGFQPIRLQKFVNEKRITVVSLVSSALAFLSPQSTPSLRLVVTGAEKCSKELASRWASRCDFYHGYGPTEATVASTLSRFEAGDELTIGRAMRHHTIYICNQELKLVEPGEAGEICIGGAAVAAGYWNQQALTAARFLSDPWNEGARLYRTGDLGRLMPDGRVQFLGRGDHQVKIGGYRIELEEIEQAVLAVPGVKNAAAIVESPDTVPRIAVLFTAEPDGLADEVIAMLRRALPAYMWPASARQIPDFPYLESGKIDRRALSSV